MLRNRTRTWVAAFAAVGLLMVTAAGVDTLVRSVPDLRHTPVRFTFTTWMLPCLVTVAAASVIPSQAGNPQAWLLSTLMFGGLMLLVLTASYGTLLPEARFHRAARLGLNVATFVAAMALYYYIYGLQVRSLLSATRRPFRPTAGPSRLPPCT